MNLYPATGTCDDLLFLLACEEFRRNRDILPSKPGWARAFVEPPLNLAGLLLCLAARLTPSDLMLAVEDRIYRALSGGEKSPFDAGSEALKQGRELIGRVLRETGQEPALVCLLSHPPALGELVYLNMELLRHALWALRCLRGRPCRPSMVIAVDPFALDTVPLCQEAVYAGFMGRYHIGMDRLIHFRNWVGRCLYETASWCTVAARIVRHLKANGEMAMVLSGGVPTTGRLFYCSREYLWHLRRHRPGFSPVETYKRLQARAPEFARFCLCGQIGEGLKKSAWRMMEAWLLAALAQEEALTQADQGEVSAAGRAAFLAVAEAMGYLSQAAQAQFEKFREEFFRQTPYRERLFHVLTRRVVARGNPLVFIPLVHGRGGTVRIELRTPTAVLGVSRIEGEEFLDLLMPQVENFARGRVPLGNFCRDFVRAHYD